MALAGTPVPTAEPGVFNVEWCWTADTTTIPTDKPLDQFIYTDGRAYIGVNPAMPVPATAPRFDYYTIHIDEEKSMPLTDETGSTWTAEDQAKQLEKEAKRIRKRAKVEKAARKSARRVARERAAIKKQAVADLRAISAERKSYRSVAAAETLLKMLGELS